ncbi:hypothetical protein [Actinomycetospora lemnae]|uniref:Uncharacterized protein n=1 Tax=Actinomycetospora lemnae TaxID=3019891 RepID=A0ABT5SVG8_9PSEU|nr:hypothetical protein [Actinomycetospora sp. DW7H6]MDD7966789.1 hypothetical protein [Actinomycetospora sp. DW7H6]
MTSLIRMRDVTAERTAGDRDENLSPVTPFGLDPGRSQLVLVGLGLVLWLISLTRIDLRGLDDLGLVSVLPVTFFGALALIATAFAIGLAANSRRRLLDLHVLALVVVLHATSAFLFTAPKFGYVYKHLAVIDFIQQYGVVYREIDIYQNWPGFFAAAAVLADRTGVDALAFANWAQPFFALVAVLALRYVFGGLTRDHRRIAAGLWVFVLGAWLLPTYLSPQSMGYVLTLLVFGVVLRHLRPESRSAQPSGLPLAVPAAIGSWWTPRGLLATLRSVPRDEPQGDARPFPRVVAIVVVLALSAAVVVSHQLSPFFLVLGLAVMVVVRRCDVRWLPVAVLVMTVIQVWLSWDYVSTHQTVVSFDLWNNVRGAQSGSPSAGSVGHQLVGTTARVVSLLLVVAAGVGWWRARLREAWILVLALTPVLLVLVQGYGGEGIYRIFSFMCPWLAFLAGGLLLAPAAGLRRLVVVAGTSMVALLLLLVAAFGLDRVNAIQPEEVAAGRWFETYAPPGSALTLLSSNFPAPQSARYTLYYSGGAQWGAEITSNPMFVGRRLGPTEVTEIVQSLNALRQPGQHVYLALGPSQVAFAESYGYAPEGSLTPLSALLIADPRLQVVFHDGDAWILEVGPST